MKKIISFISLILIVACGTKNEKPSPFIEKDKMIDILYDFSVLSGIDAVSAYYTDTIPTINATAILNKHQIDSLTFVTNNQYYINLEDATYFEIQEEVKRRLEAQKSVVDSIIAKTVEEQTSKPTELKSELSQKSDSVQKNSVKAEKNSKIKKQKLINNNLKFKIQ